MPLHDVSDTGLGPLQYVGYNTIGGTTATATASTITKVQKQIVLPTPALVVSVDMYLKGDGSHVGSFFAGLQYDNAGSPIDIACQGNYTGSASGGSTGIYLNFVPGSTPRWVSIPMGVYLPAGDLLDQRCLWRKRHCRRDDRLLRLGGHEQRPQPQPQGHGDRMSEFATPLRSRAWLVPSSGNFKAGSRLTIYGIL